MIEVMLTVILSNRCHLGVVSKVQHLRVYRLGPRVLNADSLGLLFSPSGVVGFRFRLLSTDTFDCPAAREQW